MVNQPERHNMSKGLGGGMSMSEFLDHLDEKPHVIGGLRDVSLAQQKNPNVIPNAWSIYAAMHALRWDRNFTAEYGRFKITNDFGPGYARTLMWVWPEEFAGYFDTDECKWWSDEMYEEWDSE